MDAQHAPEQLRVRRADPVYNAHSYLTKVPIAAILPFIEAFSRPGDTVLDPFAGSGMTGVAAAIAGRRAVLSDISTLGRHVGENYVNLVDPSSLRAAAEGACRDATSRIGQDPYSATCTDCGRDATLIRTVWSITVECPACAADIVYYEALAENGWKKRALRCPRCRSAMSTREARRTGEQAVCDVIVCACRTTQKEQPPQPGSRIEPDDLGIRYPTTSLSKDLEMFNRSALAKHGLTSISSFFSRRNLAVLGALWATISEEHDRRVRAKLSFAFTAILGRASKRYQWSRKRPLNAANQNYYIAPVFYEWSVFDLYLRKVEAIIRSDAYVAGEATRRGSPRPDVTYSTASATDLGFLADGSVDYVFTDPPFGSNIFYSDMNLFAEAWLENRTDPELEAVVHTTNGRRELAAQRYEEILASSFTECRRVLRPAGWLTVVFSNSDGRMWSLLTRSLRAAGFSIDPDRITVLDKGQRSVKGLASGVEGTVTCDLIFTVKRSDVLATPSEVEPQESLNDTALSVLAASGSASLTDASHWYVGAIRRYLHKGWRLDKLSLSSFLDAMQSLGLERDPQSARLTTQLSLTS